MLNKYLISFVICILLVGCVIGADIFIDNLNKDNKFNCEGNLCYKSRAIGKE